MTIVTGGRITDEETLRATARMYALRHGLTLTEPFGSGKDGIVYSAQSNAFPGKTAVKTPREPDAWRRETQGYERLREREISAVEGFRVPLLIRHAEELLTLEITIVAPPFVLDFASAYLDTPPDFPAEVWEQWESDKIEQFEERWETVQRVLATLRLLGIYMLDASPSNIRFE